MALVTYIPKCVLEEETLVALKDLGIKFEEGYAIFGKIKVNHIKVYNLTENQIFDKLDYKQITESTSKSDLQKSSYASRATTIIYMQIRKISQIKDPNLRAVGATSLLAAINSVANLDPTVATKFLSLVRGLSV